jgi:hypothetical protein
MYSNAWSACKQRIDVCSFRYPGCNSGISSDGKQRQKKSILSEIHERSLREIVAFIHTPPSGQLDFSGTLGLGGKIPAALVVGSFKLADHFRMSISSLNVLPQVQAKHPLLHWWTLSASAYDGHTDNRALRQRKPVSPLD